MLAEAERVVQAVVGASGTILDCVAGRRKYDMLDSLSQEVGSLAARWRRHSLLRQIDAFEESGVLPPGVELLELETDVGWYGRHCRRTLRNQVE